MSNFDLRVARAAHRNACRHLQAARVLQEAEFHGQAQALAILGIEEAGKVMYHWFNFLGVPMREDLPNKIRRRHVEKQLLGWLAMAVGRLVDGCEEFDDIPADGELADLPEILNGLIPALHARLDESADDLEIEGEPVAEKALDTEKMRGLYVDVDPAGVIQTPESVTSGEAAVHLEWLGRACAVIAQVLSGTTDELQEVVREMIRPHLPWEQA